MRAVLLLIVMTGCELVFPLEPGDDAPPGPDGMFTQGTRVVITPEPTAGYNDADPCLFAGETELAFTRAENAGTEIDIYVAAVNDGPAGWDLAQLASVSQPARLESNPKLSPDGQAMWIAMASMAAPVPEILAFRRASPGATSWTETTAMDAAGLDSALEDRPGTPTLGQDRVIVQHGTQLYEYLRSGPAAPWVEMSGTLDAVNALGIVRTPQLSADGGALVFSAETGGWLDLYLATRAAAGLPFEAPVPIAEVNTPDNESDPWLSADRRRLWFSRRGPGLPPTSWGIYFTQR